MHTLAWACRSSCILTKYWTGRPAGVMARRGTRYPICGEVELLSEPVSGRAKRRRYPDDLRNGGRRMLGGTHAFNQELRRPLP